MLRIDQPITVVPPFITQVMGYTMPRTGDEARSFVAERNREAREKCAREDAEHAEYMAEIERQGNAHGRIKPQPATASRTFATSSASRTSGGSRPRPSARPAAPADDLDRRWAALKTPSTSAPKTIDSEAVYLALNTPRGLCGECGTAKPGPAHGCVSDNIKPAAPRARSLAQIAGDVYGFLGGGSGDGLIAASPRGGSR